MSAPKLKHHRGADRIGTQLLILLPLRLKFGPFVLDFHLNPSEAIKRITMGDSESSPLAALCFVLRTKINWYCFMPHINTDMKLCILPNRLTCSLLGLFTYVLPTGISVLPSTINKTNTQNNNNNLKDVPVKHFNSTLALKYFKKYNISCIKPRWKIQHTDILIALLTKLLPLVVKYRY